MEDLIRRQDVIDLLDEWGGGFKYIEVETEGAIDAIMDLPSAQPEPTYEQVMEYCKKRYMSLVTNEFLAHMYSQCAQPERKRVSGSKKIYIVTGRIGHCMFALNVENNLKTLWKEISVRTAVRRWKERIMNNKFAERLFDVLVEHKLMPAQFASEMGISPNTVYNWLRGDYLPNLIMFFRICEDYDVDPMWLWGGDK